MDMSCHSVDNKQSNNSAIIHAMSQIFFSGKGGLGQGQGPKKPTDLSSYWSENSNLSLKLKKKLANDHGPTGQNQLFQFWTIATFCITQTQSYFVLLILNDKKFDWPIFGWLAGMGLTALHKMSIFP